MASTKTKLVMILLVRDEADIIEDNIRFHLDAGVDYVVAIDNGSIDGTREILEEYAKMDVVHVIDEPGRDYAQSKWVNNAARYAIDSLNADWIFSNDADEFWVAPDGKLESVIGVAGSAILQCNRYNMITAYEVLGDKHWAENLTCRVTKPVARSKLSNIYNDILPCPYFYLDLPSKIMMRAEGLMDIIQGNHSAHYSHDVEKTVAAIDIYHFPVRSKAQFERKIVQGGMAYQANLEFGERVGWHWRRWYRMYQNAGVEKALADVLPSKRQMDNDLREGIVIKDYEFKSLYQKFPNVY